MRKVYFFLLTLFLLINSSVWALTPNVTGSIDHNNGPSWSFPLASIDMDFSDSRYRGLVPGQLTISRASVEYEICAGQLYSFATNQAAITPGCGLWVWEARTNSFYNSTMAGGSAGTPPTNVTIYSQNGLTETAGAPFTANGITWFPITLTGTATTSGTINIVAFNNTTTTPATYGQTWAMSTMYYQTGVLPTSASGLTFEFNERGSGGVSTGSGTYNVVSATTTPTWLTSTAPIVNTATQYVLGRFDSYSNNGSTYSGTMYFGVPQLELNPNLPANVSSAVMAASGAGGVNGVGVYTVTGGTCATSPTLNVTWASGVLTVNSVANAGACSVLPPSPATLAYASGAATGWTGATVTLTPVNNASSGFSTGPILTSSGPATRAETDVSVRVPSGPASSLIANATPYAPATYPVEQVFAALSDGSYLNFAALLRHSNNGFANLWTELNHTTAGYVGSTVLTTGVAANSVATVAPSSQSVYAHGAAATIGTVVPPALSELDIGFQAGFSRSCNCLISRVAVWPRMSLPSAAALVIAK